MSGPVSQGGAPHIPVLIGAIIEAAGPIEGHWIDGTFGAGGYSRALLEAGADRMTGVDRDPLAHEMAAGWLAGFEGRISLQENTFSNLDAYGPADGIVLDLGVSSMQLDIAERGFSFMRDGPLDMRMGQDGPTAADLVNGIEEAALADILFHYGEERAARRIARAIVKGRPFHRTLELADAISACLPRPKPGQPHPATRSFQAVRIALNDEMGELITGLEAAERALVPGGKLAIVTFHSLEDRVAKRFLQQRAGKAARTNRYAPEAEAAPAPFRIVTRKAIAADADEVAANQRARSAKLRVAERTEAEAAPADRALMGLPGPKNWWSS